MVHIQRDGRSDARRGYSQEARAARRAFIAFWKTGHAMETREDLVACARAMKAGGLYSATTYDVDIATSIRKVMRGMDGGGK